jgi:phosphinothricin acetyltransferase
LLRETVGVEVEIERMRPDDGDAVLSIYGEGIAGGGATFETEVPSWEEWSAAHLEAGRLVARDRNGVVVGWAALSPVSSRAAYRGVADVSVYVTGWARKGGVGTALLQALIEESEGAGLWTLQTNVFPANRASLALLKSMGFRRVGVRERIGRHGDEWRDTVLLERRSPAVGGNEA